MKFLAITLLVLLASAGNASPDIGDFFEKILEVFKPSGVAANETAHQNATATTADPEAVVPTKLPVNGTENTITTEASVTKLETSPASATNLETNVTKLLPVNGTTNASRVTESSEAAVKSATEVTTTEKEETTTELVDETTLLVSSTTEDLNTTTVIFHLFHPNTTTTTTELTTVSSTLNSTLNSTTEASNSSSPTVVSTTEATLNPEKGDTTTEMNSTSTTLSTPLTSGSEATKTPSTSTSATTLGNASSTHASPLAASTVNGVLCNTTRLPDSNMRVITCAESAGFETTTGLPRTKRQSSWGEGLDEDADDWPSSGDEFTEIST